LDVKERKEKEKNIYTLDIYIRIYDTNNGDLEMHRWQHSAGFAAETLATSARSRIRNAKVVYQHQRRIDTLNKMVP